MEPSKNVKNAFLLIDKLYEESALLLKEIIKQLASEGLEKIDGNKFLKENSDSLNHPEKWFPKYGSIHFVDNLEKVEKKIGKHRLFVGIRYMPSDYNNDPVLISGVGRIRETENAGYSYRWAEKAFLPNKEEVSLFLLKNNDMAKIEKPISRPSINSSLMYTRCNLGDESYNWFKDAVYFARPLLEFKTPKEVKKSVKKMILMWESRDKMDHLLNQANIDKPLET